MDHPFAITLDVGTSMSNKTGSWRNVRPEYVHRLPPCNHACPAGEDIQGWLAHAEAGDYEAAWRSLTENNPLPAVMGRVCYHPCEGACNRKEIDSAVGINSVERFLGDMALDKGWTFAPPASESGKRVLIVGAGNSGCDIAVDAVHYADSVDISVRRGYYFVPKYVFGQPADTLGGKFKMPPWLKQKIDSVVLQWFTGDPARFGLPKPDYKMYESHPVVNSLVLHHLGHGDIHVKPDIARLHGHSVFFKDGSAQDYDLVLCATGYKLHYPFIDHSLLNWQGMAPQLYLNILSPRFDNLAVMGMIEASGIGWQGRYEQAELVARFFKAQSEGSPRAEALRQAKAGPPPDLSGGFKYLKLERMAYYVHKDTYRNAVRAAAAALA